jgi:hypothetical protein
MQQSTEYRQKTIKHIILSYETQPVLKSLFTACMQWYEVWRQHVYTTCRQSVTAGNHSVSSVWPAANISPLQHKLLHADFNLNHPGIQDLNLLLLLLLLLHWTTTMGGQAYQLQSLVKLSLFIFYIHRPDTWSLLCLTAIICHFLLPICHVCEWLAVWATLMDQQDVANDICKIK